MASCVCAVALGTLSACGSAGSSTGTAPGPAAPAAGEAPAPVITIKDFGFTTPSSVSPGTTVRVDNEDSVAHTVTADSGNAFDEQAAPGSSGFTAPSAPGTYPFHCNIHPEMHGTLVVR